MTKNYCVIDQQGFYIDLVSKIFDLDPITNEEVSSIFGYQLKDGETLIDSSVPTKKNYDGDNGFVKPKWQDKMWIEGATTEEIEIFNEENPNPNIYHFEEAQAKKLSNLSETCNQTIIAGMDVETTEGVEHFSLEETDQINLTTALSAINQGAKGYPYHADKKLCRMFTAIELKAIAEKATAHKLYHTTLCNHLLILARRATTTAELDEITYSADCLPLDLAQNMQKVLAASGVTE